MNEINLGASMTDWAVGLQARGKPDIAAQIDQDKISSLRMLEKLGLPRYRQAIFGVDIFLESPETHLKAFDLQQYFAILSPRDNTLRRHRARELTKADVPEFIHKTLTPADLSKYDLILQESFRHRYGGNIVCETDGSVLVEAVAGETGHNMLVTGRKTPEFTMRRDPLTGLFSYSFEDPKLRSVLLQTVLAIPHHYGGGDHAPEYHDRSLEFLPGYYEFYLAQRQENSALEPIFIDYSDQPAFRPGTSG